MSTQITTLGVKVVSTGAGKAKREISSIGVAASKVKKSVALLGTALVALGVGKVLKDSIKYTASIEDLRIQLKFLTGSTKSASKAFAEMTKFASKTPFALQEIQQSSASLLVAVGNDVDKLGDILQITGEISAQFGLSFQQTAQQLQKVMSAGAGAADTFREKGVLAMMGFRVGVKYSIEESGKIIEKWAKDNKGAIEELKNTFTGKVSMMGDAWDKLLLTFGEAGVLEHSKDLVQEMTGFLKDSETIKNVKSMADGFVKTGQNLGKIVSSLFTAVQLIKIAGDEVAGDKWFPATEHYFDKSMKFLDGMKTFGDILIFANKQAKELNKTLNMSLSSDPFAIFDEPFIKKQRIIDLPKKIVTEIETPEEAKKLKKRQELGVDKIIQKVFNITEKLTKKRTELEKITEAQISAEKILGTQLKNSKITMEQYTHGVEIMKTEIQNYNNVIKKIAFDEKIENMAQSMEDAITDSIMNMGQELSSFKDLATSIFRTIAADMVRIRIAEPLASSGSKILGNVLGSMLGAPAGGSTGGTFGNKFTGNTASYAGGGFTGGGARSGGIDGKGGFTAILHPNETVIDHQGQEQRAAVSNFYDIKVTYSPQVNALDPRTAALVIAENAPTVVGIIRQAFNRNGQPVAI